MEEEEIVGVRVTDAMLRPDIIFVPYTMVENSPSVVYEGTFAGMRRYQQTRVDSRFYGVLKLNKNFKFGRGYIN